MGGGGLLFGIVAGAIASSKGRSFVGWFFAGLFFSVFGVIGAAVVSNRDNEKKHFQASTARSRRHNERQRHDRSVNDRRFDDIEQRLTAHDVGLGLDTTPGSQAARVEGGNRPPELSGDGPGKRAAHGVGADRTWYWSNDSMNRATASPDQLRGLFQNGRISDETLLWTEGMQDWCTLADLPELGEVLRV
ncbi:MAG: hypothetical protein ACI8PQ_002368 [Planctomycetota bacterium]|jgi:hypothetical protein